MSGNFCPANGEIQNDVHFKKVLIGKCLNQLQFFFLANSTQLTSKTELWFVAHSFISRADIKEFR